MGRYLEWIVLGTLAVLFVHRVSSQSDDLRACEVVFALDDSGSMTQNQFNLITIFVSLIVNNLNNFGNTSGIRVGVTTFSSSSKIVVELDQFKDRQAFSDYLSTIFFNGGRTYTHLTFPDMQSILDKGSKQNKKAGVVITDGNADFLNLTRDAAEEFKRKGNTLIFIGIGIGINVRFMKSIVSTPDLYFQVENFEKLIEIKDRIVEAVCVPPCQVKKQDVCKTCSFVNGIYLFPDCDVCYKYKQCIDSDRSLTFSRYCPFGEFFDFVSITCIRAGSISCFSDECRLGGGKVKYDISCRAYWECVNDQAVEAKCCNPSFRFDEATSDCVPDSSCTDPCPPVHRKPECVLSEVPGNLRAFYRQISDNVVMTELCAPGTRFNKLECDCTLFGAIDRQECTNDRNILHIPFSRHSKDIRRRLGVANPKVNGNKVWRRRRNNEWVGWFNGKSRLIVNGLANNYWGRKFVIRTRFQESGTDPGKPETIFGNGDCNKRGSIVVNYNRADNSLNATVIFLDAANHERNQTIIYPNVSPGTWKDIELRYNGNELSLTVDGTPQRIVASGVVARRHCAMQFGSGALHMAWFNGYQDEIYVFIPCIPPEGR